MLKTLHCPHSLAACTLLLQQSIDISCRPVQQQNMLEQTDGRTPYCFIDPAEHTMQAVPMMQFYDAISKFPFTAIIICHPQHALTDCN